MLLLGASGSGKTTIARQLSWIYSHRPTKQELLLNIASVRRAVYNEVVRLVDDMKECSSGKRYFVNSMQVNKTKLFTKYFVLYKSIVQEMRG